ncbi:hypothetical protein MRB53_007290 [Persea americana]|uniref:Uncharacterized protein n=1 Tax=Persea americana TaxID=3435 RepID=A0ACC2MK58_PERAE|nr:hypothetical protein MRB53_007290 [Persea americana]
MHQYCYWRLQGSPNSGHQFVKKQLPPYFSTLQNHKDQTKMEVFTETHLELAMQRAKWLSKASQSCSIVATLIISMVFATMATVPGGLIQEQQDRGLPVYKGKLAFNVF